MLKFEGWIYVQKYIMIQFNHLISTIHNYFIKLNPLSKKCPIHNTELRGYSVFSAFLCAKFFYATSSGISKSSLFIQSMVFYKSDWIQNRKIVVFGYFHAWKGWNLVIPITL